MAALLAWALLQDAAALIARLGSDDPAVRDAATRRLIEAGPSALPDLRKAAAAPDAEVAARAGYVIKVFECRVLLPPAVRKAMPEAAEQLAASGSDGWFTVFTEASGSDEDGRRHPDLGRADLAFLAGFALRHCTSKEQAEFIFDEAIRFRLRSPVPELIGLMTHARPEVRRVALHLLMAWRVRSAVAKIQPLLTDGNGDVAETAWDALGDLVAPPQRAALARAVAHPDWAVRKEAFAALGWEQDPGPRSHLEAADSTIRLRAIDLLDWSSARDVLEAVRARLADEDDGVRREAVELLGGGAIEHQSPGLSPCSPIQVPVSGPRSLRRWDGWTPKAISTASPPSSKTGR